MVVVQSLLVDVADSLSQQLVERQQASLAKLVELQRLAGQHLQQLVLSHQLLWLFALLVLRCLLSQVALPLPQVT